MVVSHHINAHSAPWFIPFVPITLDIYTTTTTSPVPQSCFRVCMMYVYAVHATAGLKPIFLANVVLNKAWKVD